MNLGNGSQLGPYEIVSPIGAGGMGEVYRARDMRLGRDVAIKVLPQELASHSERVRRFEQEARAVAALNHPNILAIYDVGDHEGLPYLVTELLEGETLRELLLEGKVPIRRAVGIGVQIAEGLAAAHEKGIIHRDLKPANVFITKDGRTKILDFGLARLVKGEDSSSPDSTAPTEDPGTKPGALLGTIGYMSPEQVKGRPADARSDIFSLGVLLYEMLSGKKAFTGDSEAEVMTAILKDDPPPLAAEGLELPPLLERTVAHCLEKDPDRRFQSTRDIAFALESVTSGSSISVALPPLPEDKHRRTLKWAVGILAVMLVAAGLWSGGLLQGRHRYRRPIPNFTQITFRRGMITSARFSPDGNTIYYSAAWGGKPLELFAKRLDTVESQPLGIENARLLAVSSGEMAVLLHAEPSPSGRPIASTLARVPLGGGAPREVAEGVLYADYAPGTTDLAIVRQVTGSTWVFMNSGKQRLEYPIGKVLYEAKGRIDCPRFSPAGDRIGFIDRTNQFKGNEAIVVVDLKGNSRVLTGGWDWLMGLAWRRDGEEVWFTGHRAGGTPFLYAVDLEGHVRVVLRAADRQTLHDISTGGRVLLARELSSRGAYGLLYGDTQERDLSWSSLTSVFYVSEDGKTEVFWVEKPDFAVYLWRVSEPWPVRLCEGGLGWLSPDQKYALTMTRDASRLRVVPTGAGEAVLLPKGPIELYAGGLWLPTGNRVMFGGNEAGKPPRTWVQEVPDGQPIPVAPEGYVSSYGAISPDGRYVACASFLPGAERIYAQFPVDGGEPLPIPGIAAGEEPISYSDDGRYIYVREHDIGLAAPICKLDLKTGRREPWRTIRPSDPAGAVSIYWIKVSMNGRYYVYFFNRALDDLYVVDGLR